MSDQSDTFELPTRCAHWGYTDHHYGAWRVFGELSETLGTGGLCALAASGQRINAEQQAIVDDVALALTLADPRIWPLKAARMVATYGRPTFAATVGALVADDAAIGPSAAGRAALLQAELAEVLRPLHDDPERQGVALAQFVAAQRILPGFGVPFRDVDERRIFLERRIRDRGRDGLFHWRASQALIEEVKKQRGLEPNVATTASAALLDAGLPASSVGPLAHVLITHMFVANALEGAQPEQRALQQMPSKYVRYVGRERRESGK